MKEEVMHHMLFNLGCRSCSSIKKCAITIITESEESPDYRTVLTTLNNNDLIELCDLCGSEKLEFWNVRISDVPYLVNGENAYERMRASLRRDKQTGKVALQISGDFSNELIFETGIVFMLETIEKEITSMNFLEKRFDNSVINAECSEINNFESFSIDICFFNKIRKHKLVLITNEMIPPSIILPAISNISVQLSPQIYQLIHSNNGSFK